MSKDNYHGYMKCYEYKPSIKLVDGLYQSFVYANHMYRKTEWVDCFDIDKNFLGRFEKTAKWEKLEDLNVSEKFSSRYTVICYDYKFYILRIHFRAWTIDEVQEFYTFLSNSDFSVTDSEEYDYFLIISYFGNSRDIYQRNKGIAMKFDYNMFQNNMNSFIDSLKEKFNDKDIIEGLEHQAKQLFKKNIEKFCYTFNCTEKHLQSKNFDLKHLFINKLHQIISEKEKWQRR
jgi:hypothetical protein